MIDLVDVRVGIDHLVGQVDPPFAERLSRFVDHFLDHGGNVQQLGIQVIDIPL